MKPLSLYLHIPFCRSRCAYCGFTSCTELALREPYTAALCRALEQAPLEGYEAATVYFGGGTPSLLGEGLLRVLEEIRRRLPVSPEAEITLEANPGTVTPALLEALREGGFNRISFGLQDCDDRVLKMLGRCHTADEGEAAVHMAREAGFRNISVDFMLATPGQTPEKAAELARYGLSLGVPHLSSYLLKVEPGTPFARDHAERLCPDEDTAADCYLAYYSVLEQAGFCHYEISNAARAGYESRHNCAYWQLSEYLGIGASAASFFGGERFRFGDSIRGFIGCERPWEATLPEGPGGGWEEALMLALRLSSGLTPALTGRFGQSYAALRQKAAPLAAAGLLKADASSIALTDRGFLLSNSIILALLEGTV